MVPVGSARLSRHLGTISAAPLQPIPAAEVQGSAAPGVSSGQRLRRWSNWRAAPSQGVGFEWTDLAYEQKQAGTRPSYIRASVLFVFMVLAAQYESWSQPLSVILIVADVSAGGRVRLLLRGMSVDIQLKSDSSFWWRWPRRMQS